MAKTGPKQKPRRERFYDRVERSDGCWLWTGAINTRRGGYGYFYDDDTRLRRAHRVAWELERGPLADDDVVMHSCDTPACVRIDHLSLGTQTENMRDMRIKGRGATPPRERGTDRYNAKLDDEKVRWLRQAYADGETLTDIAMELGVSRNAVRRAATGEGWKHVS